MKKIIFKQVKHMTLTSHMKKTFQNEAKGTKDKNYNYNAIAKKRLIEFRKETKSIVPTEKPTNLARAKELGYKAKQGITVVRVRVRKGSGLHRKPVKARRPKRMGVKKLTRRKSIQSIAEERAAKKHPNCEVMNSYYIAEDGKNKYFEVILIDPANPCIKNDKKLKWLTEKQHKGRVHRGLTSAAKKSRGLHKKGKGAEKARPSQRAHDRKLK
jgi:large subunit ribosomal protein L15e